MQRSNLSKCFLKQAFSCSNTAFRIVMEHAYKKNRSFAEWVDNKAVEKIDAIDRAIEDRKKYLNI